MGHHNMMEMNENTTEGVKMLLGDPRKAIVKLAVPIVFSLIANGILHLTDMIWVSGLGPEALSALGFIVPLHLVASAIATGIGTGGGTCISQSIGARDKTESDAYTIHMFLLLVIVAALVVAFMSYIVKPLFLFMGAGKTIDLALSYSRIMIFGFIFLLFSEGVYAIFRSEGNAKLVMVISLTGVLINIVLDPLFIYTLGMGVPGAAWASFIALGVATLICFYWLFVKKATYVSIDFKGFSIRKKKIQSILHLGIPVSLGQLLMAVMMFANIKVISYVGGVNGVAVFSTGLRYMHFLMLPLIGISSAAVTVVGAAFGAGNRDKIHQAYRYSLKIGSLSAGAMCLGTIIAAPLIAKMFTWSEGSTVLAGDLIVFLQVVFLGHPPLAVAMMTGSLFVGSGKSVKALLLEILRNIILTIPFVMIFGIVLNYGLAGVWSGIVAANWLLAIIAFMWAQIFLRTHEIRSRSEMAVE